MSERNESDNNKNITNKFNIQHILDNIVNHEKQVEILDKVKHFFGGFIEPAGTKPNVAKSEAAAPLKAAPEQGEVVSVDDANGPAAKL